MRRSLSRLLGSALLLSTPFAVLHAQSVAAVEHSARILAPVDAGNTVRLSGHVPVYADPARLPSTALDTSATFGHLTVVLNRAPAVQAAFEQLLADQVNPSSPRFHQWLTPAQVGQLYGPAQADVDAVAGWLQGQGLTIDDISPNRLFINFSGPVGSVEKAFGTQFRTFSLANGESRYSLTQEPTVPAAIASVVQTIAGLSQTIHHSTAAKGELVTPKSAQTGGHLPSLDSTSGSHYLVSGDYAVAYDINPVYSASITGTGQTIAVAGQSRVAATDISTLESIEGLPAKQPNVVIPPTGLDPGAAQTAVTSTDNGAQDEATLDVDRTISTAPGAGIDLVVSADVNGGKTYATSGLYIAINYAIALNDPILTISFGGCEALNGQANDVYEQSIFQTAVSQGITTFVSAGDSGAAGCNGFSSTIPASQVLSINDLCANQYVTCLGGTEFADSTNTSTYWAASNGTNYVSLLSYIPEGVWNDVAVSTGGQYSQGATGGGASVFLARPSWQTGTGVPTGSYRLVPDIALTSSTHDGFVTCLAYQNASCGSFFSFGGTSAAAPSMAGIQALVNQKLGGRQGNINPTLYTLGNAGMGFHDVTVASSGVTNCLVTTPSLCNNSTPTSTTLTGGLSGYTVNAGFDEATGWGSLDVAKYLAAIVAGGAATFSVTPTSASLTLLNTSGATVTDALSIASVNNFAGTVALSCAVTTASGTAAGTCAVSPASATLAASGVGNSTLTVTNTVAGASGVLSVTVTGTSGTTVVSSSTISVSVSGPTFTLYPATTTPSLISSTTGSTSVLLTLASVNNFAGTVALTCSVTTASGTAAGTCSVSPATESLATGGSAIPTLTLNSSTVGAAGTLTVKVTGTSGAIVASTTLTATVTAPTFTLTPGATSLTFTSGATTGNTTPITLASTNTFAGAVGLTCSIAASTSAPYYAPTCAISPSSVTLASGGTGTATLTITSTTAVQVTSSLDRKGSGLERWGLGGGATLALLAFCAPLCRRRRGMLGSLALLGLLAAGLGTLAGCSGSGGVVIPTTHSSAGTYIVTVTGAGTTTGATAATTATAVLTVTIN